jgi:glycosyltransferase involved in cell wall biosynthesis
MSAERPECRPSDRLDVRPPSISSGSSSRVSAVARCGGSERVRALILAYDFPPLVSVGGLRPYSWYRYLKQFGVEPTVVTRQWSNEHGSAEDYVAPSDSKETVIEASQFGTILRTPYEPNLSNRLLQRSRTRFQLIRRAITAWYEVGQYMLPIGPRRQLFLTARGYLRQHGADVIVATGEPFVLFVYASQLSKEFGIPWIADYRDPWTHDRARLPLRIARAWNAMLEAKFTASASAITTVSEFFADLIATLVKRKPIYVVPNGYDPEAVSRAGWVEQGREKLAIAFVGTIYDGHRLGSVLAACSEFLVRERDVHLELRFVGIDRQSEVEVMVGSRYPALMPFVRFFGKAPNAQVVETLATANAFLLFNSHAYVGTKIYDYLALRRKILLCFADDNQPPRGRGIYYLNQGGMMRRRVQEEMIRATRSGVIIRDEKHLVDTLSDLYREFLENRCIACNSVGIEAYSRESHARRMAEVIQGVGRGMSVSNGGLTPDSSS